MKRILKGIKWVALFVVTVILLIVIPIFANKLYQNTRASFLTEQEKQLEDLDRLEYLFENQFGGYQVLPGKATFIESLASLRASVNDGSITSQQDFNLSIIKVVAAFRDPHTSVLYNSSGLLNNRFPFYINWSDGEFYLLSGQVDKKWLGAKVIRFENTPSVDVYAKLSAYANAPNEAGITYFIDSFTRSADILYKEGISTKPNQITIEVMLDGETSQLTFNSISKDQFATLSDYFRMSDKLGEYEKPLYQSNFKQNYWYTYLENEKAFYLRYSACVDQGNVNAFWKEVFTQVDELKPDKFIVDVRGNGGGDTQTHSYFINQMKNDTLVNKYGKLYTLIDGGTGSAAVAFAADMEKMTNTILVGDKTMDKPNTTSDPTYFTLPHSEVKMLLPNLYSLHSYIEDKRDAVIPQVFIAQNIDGDAYTIDEVLDSVLTLNHATTVQNYAKLPAPFEGQYSFSPIRNASIYQRDAVWYISIDDLIEAPILQSGSTWYTNKFNLVLNPKDDSAQTIELQIHNTQVTLNRITETEISLVKAINERQFDKAKSIVESLTVNGIVPIYLDRPFFQSRTYALYNQYGTADAFKLNELTKSIYPGDPVASIVDFQLYDYDGDTFGKVKSVGSVISKLVSRYYTFITTDKVINDDYNAFIGK